MKFLKLVFVSLVIIVLAFTSTSIAKPPEREKEYIAKQIVNFKVDGDLSEWKRAEVIIFDGLKDVGNSLPKPKDFTGSARIGWNAEDPHRIYFAVEITDDEHQDIHPDNDKWWEDDSMEFMFDFDNGMVRASLIQWTIAANGEEISASGTKENTEWVVLNDGNEYIYEVAIDPTLTPLGKDFEAEDGLVIGHAIHANDCENGTREHQIGWTAGGAWDAMCYGNLIFSEEILAVEVTGKLAMTWGVIKTQ